MRGRCALSLQRAGERAHDAPLGKQNNASAYSVVKRLLTVSWEYDEPAH
jgi:hypothetical protein